MGIRTDRNTFQLLLMPGIREEDSNAVIDVLFKVDSMSRSDDTDQQSIKNMKKSLGYTRKPQH